MPNKIKTETQFARLIGATPLQVELTLVKIGSHTPKNTSPTHARLLRGLGGDVPTRNSTASSSPARPVELLTSRMSPIGTNSRAHL
jgi:homoserine O-succinyltransferase